MSPEKTVAEVLVDGYSSLQLARAVVALVSIGSTRGAVLALTASMPLITDQDVIDAAVREKTADIIVTAEDLVFDQEASR